MMQANKNGRSLLSCSVDMSIGRSMKGNLLSKWVRKKNSVSFASPVDGSTNGMLEFVKRLSHLLLSGGSICFNGALVFSVATILEITDFALPSTVDRVEKLLTDATESTDVGGIGWLEGSLEVSVGGSLITEGPTGRATERNSVWIASSFWFKLDDE
jgi:hypothetical protein